MSEHSIPPSCHLTVMVLNGPNLNLLGLREPAVYGTHTLDDVRALCKEASTRHGWALDFRQSNHEGDLIEGIHAAGELHRRGQLAGVILNAGAYTHTSIALHDAIKGTGVPVVELHISNVYAREIFRHQSWIAPVAQSTLCGWGIHGYALAIDGLAYAVACT